MRTHCLVYVVLILMAFVSWSIRKAFAKCLNTCHIHQTACQSSRHEASAIISLYEGWNFNCGNAAVTFDTAHLQCSNFHRPSMYSPMLCRTRFQRWGSHMMPLVASVLLKVWTERPTASIVSGIVLKRLPRNGSFTFGIKSKSQGLMSGEYGGWYSTYHCHLTSNWFTTPATCGRALSCRMIGVFSPRKCGLFLRNARCRLCSKKLE